MVGLQIDPNPKARQNVKVKTMKVAEWTRNGPQSTKKHRKKSNKKNG